MGELFLVQALFLAQGPGPLVERNKARVKLPPTLRCHPANVGSGSVAFDCESAAISLL